MGPEPCALMKSWQPRGRLEVGGVVEAAGLDGLQGSEPMPAAGLSVPQCEPMLGAGSAERD